MGWGGGSVRVAPLNSGEGANLGRYRDRPLYLYRVRNGQVVEEQASFAEVLEKTQREREAIAQLDLKRAELRRHRR
jgi:hypothetical protein